MRAKGEAEGAGSWGQEGTAAAQEGGPTCLPAWRGLRAFLGRAPSLRWGALQPAEVPSRPWQG